MTVRHVALRRGNCFFPTEWVDALCLYPEESIAFGCNFIVEKHFYGSVSLLVFRDNDGSALGRHQEMASTRKSDFVRNTRNLIPLFLFWNYPKSHPVFVESNRNHIPLFFWNYSIKNLLFFVKINQNKFPLFFENI